MIVFCVTTALFDTCVVGYRYIEGSMMSIKDTENLKRPFIKEAEVIEGKDTVVFGNLRPEGATLAVSYTGIKPGDRVQAWGLNKPPYDQTKVVPDGANSLTFNVPKEYFVRKKSVIFQYFIRADDDGVIGISDGASYAVIGSIPALLPAPYISDAATGVPEGVIHVSRIGVEGATLEVGYPGIKAGDSVTAVSIAEVGQPSFRSTQEVALGETSLKFSVPVEYFVVGSLASFQYIVNIDSQVDVSNPARYRVK